MKGNLVCHSNTVENMLPCTIFFEYHKSVPESQDHVSTFQQSAFFSKQHPPLKDSRELEKYHTLLGTLLGNVRGVTPQVNLKIHFKKTQTQKVPGLKRAYMRDCFKQIKSQQATVILIIHRLLKLSRAIKLCTSLSLRLCSCRD